MLFNLVESVAHFVNTDRICVHNDFAARINCPDSIFYVIHYSMCVQQTCIGSQFQMKLDEILCATEACAQIMKAMHIGVAYSYGTNALTFFWRQLSIQQNIQGAGCYAIGAPDDIGCNTKSNQWVY